MAANTVGIIIIGDEILNGTVRDANSQYLCNKFWQLGMKVSKICTIPDNVVSIAEEVKRFSKCYQFVLTTGGIGPTHDDVTLDGVAAAFNEELVTSLKLEQMWKEGGTTPNHKKSLSKMTKVPRSARLEFGSDPDWTFPLIILHNVYIYPGVPRYLQALFERTQSVFGESCGKFYMTEILLQASEFEVADVLHQVQKQYDGCVKIGSYPNKYSLRVTLEAECKSDADKACVFLRSLLPDSKVLQATVRRSRAISSSSTSVDESGEDSEKDHLGWLIRAKLEQCSEGLLQLISNAVQVIEETFKKYKPHELCLAYNGGKDCTVLLHLVHACWTRHCIQRKIKALYVCSLNPFKEVEATVQDSIERYSLDLVYFQGSIKNALENMKKTDPDIKAVLMGTRFTDPHSDSLTTFTQTDPSWPQYMRILPILEWSYGEVWEYLRLLDVPYCALYDQGYTSLGSTTDTVPNPLLKNEDHTSNGIKGFYHPAYTLTDDTMERAGRNQTL